MLPVIVAPAARTSMPSSKLWLTTLPSIKALVPHTSMPSSSFPGTSDPVPSDPIQLSEIVIKSAPLAMNTPSTSKSMILNPVTMEPSDVPLKVRPVAAVVEIPSTSMIGSPAQPGWVVPSIVVSAEMAS